MKKLYLLLFILLVASFSHAQYKKPYYVKTYYNFSNQQLMASLAKAKTDTMRLNLLNSLVWDISGTLSQDDQTKFLKQLIAIANKTKLVNPAPYRLFMESEDAYFAHDDAKTLALCEKVVDEFEKQHIDTFAVLVQMRWLFNAANKSDEKLGYYTRKLHYYLQTKQYINAGACYHCIAGYYSYNNDNNMAINNYLKANKILEPYAPLWSTNDLLVIGNEYLDWGNFDKSLFYLKMGYKRLPADNPFDKDFALSTIAVVEYNLGHYQQGLNYLDTLRMVSAKQNPPQPLDEYYYEVRALNLARMNRLPEAWANLLIAKRYNDTTKMNIVASVGRYDLEYGFYKYYQAAGDQKIAEKYLLAAYSKSLKYGTKLQVFYLKELSRFYLNEKNAPAVWKYSALYNHMNDSIETAANHLKVASYEYEQKENDQDKKVADLQQQHAVQEATIGQRNLIIWLSLAGLAVVGVLAVFVYRQLQVNKKTLAELKQTQTQLIQSEKMASLGELTAGIAHEIQNPLNFVNNFSEVSTELIDELDEELDRGDVEEAKVIASDLKQNLEKIHHHGKRADFIVKGMLEHSRTSTGERQLTNINILADEFFKLSYHGLRAKDKTFNAELVTSFDPGLPKANIIQQDIGRVLLNLFNNAFYAVHQKQKTNGGDYKPAVEVATSVRGETVVINVKDNGNGIPDDIKDKIMQPFFTTKPTGEGTGLGLSLSYDIVVKGHGGNIAVNSKEGEFTEFIITLPLK